MHDNLDAAARQQLAEELGIDIDQLNLEPGQNDMTVRMSDTEKLKIPETQDKKDRQLIRGSVPNLVA